MRLNKNILNLKCIQCEAVYPIGDYYRGCPKCYENKTPSSLSIEYKTDSPDLYSLLPYTPDSVLGEGKTPTITLNQIGKKIGLGHLQMKNEFQNPTHSHKDRMSKYLVQRAKEMNKEGIVLASSGNAGLSIAVYAAYANIKCTLVTRKDIAKDIETMIQATGATIIYTETSEERWKVVKDMAENHNCYPATNYITPPVGSNPFGVQGYKEVAYEIYDDLKDKLPTDIIIPVSRGDLLWGIFKGFKDILDRGLIKQMPRLIAVEPIPRLTKVLSGSTYTELFSGDYHHAPSIGGNTVTYQSLQALQETNGVACVVSKHALEEKQKELATQGMLLEASAVSPFCALEQLIETGDLNDSSRVLIIATSDKYVF